MTKPRSIPEPQLNAWKALLRSHAFVIGNIEQLLQAQGRIPLVEYDVLLELKNAGDNKLRMAELAERVVLSRSGLTRLVDRLEKQGYLTREPCLEDRRGTQAVLTDAGRQALRDAWPTYAEGIDRFFAQHITAEEAVTLARVLQRLVTTRSEQRNAS